MSSNRDIVQLSQIGLAIVLADQIIPPTKESLLLRALCACAIFYATRNIMNATNPEADDVSDVMQGGYGDRRWQRLNQYSSNRRGVSYT